MLAGAAAVELCAAGEALALAGGPLAFAALCFTGDDAPDAAVRGVREVLRWARQAAAEGDSGPAALIERASAPRAPFAGLALCGAGARPRIMGVCNVTPDSFSDGGDHADPESALTFARALVAAGADIVDVGGESTRPGARPVDVAEEADRVLPVIEALAGEGVTVSIDTRRAAVMRAALGAGAAIVNDVSALAGDPDSLGVVAASDAAVILMHMRGTPETMQVAPAYDDAVGDVYDALAARVAACRAAGIPAGRIAVDPGLGFGKTVAHNVALLAGLAQFHGLGCAVAVGASRKSFIGALTGEADPKARLPGSLAAVFAAVNRGAQIVRVHDVAETRQALAVWSAGNELLPPPSA
jgi:dihydropteroate synthase